MAGNRIPNSNDESVARIEVPMEVTGAFGVNRTETLKNLDNTVAEITSEVERKVKVGISRRPTSNQEIIAELAKQLITSQGQLAQASVLLIELT